MVCLQSKTIEEVSKAMYVSHSTVERLVHLYRTTGDVSSIQQRHGPCRTLTEQEELTVLEIFLQNPGIYLKEVQEELFTATGKTVCCSTLCRTAKRLGLSRQKMKRVAVQQSGALRARYMAEIGAFDPDTLLFTETGCDKHNVKRYFGYGIRGITPVTYHLLQHGKRISAIGVMSTRGVEDVYLVEGSVSGETFLQFVQQSLLNIVQPFNGTNPRSVVILDNASIHHVEAVTSIISAAGALVRFLPPYSPDLNPIEEHFSKVKGYLTENETAYLVTDEPR